MVIVALCFWLCLSFSCRLGNDMKNSNTLKTRVRHAIISPQGAWFGVGNTLVFDRQRTLKYAVGWNYRGCLHQTCPPVDRKEMKHLPIPIPRHGCPVSLFCFPYLPVSGLGDVWACCLPLKAQSFLGVPLHNQTLVYVAIPCDGGPIPDRRKLTSQKVEKFVAKVDQLFCMNYREHNSSWKGTKECSVVWVVRRVQCVRGASVCCVCVECGT